MIKIDRPAPWPGRTLIAVINPHWLKAKPDRHGGDSD